MKSLVSFSYMGRESFGQMNGSQITDLTDFFRGRYTSISDAANKGELPLLFRYVSEPNLTLSQVKFLPPLLNPQKIICVGINFPGRDAEYKDNKAVSKFMSLFVRFPSSFVGHNQKIIRPPESEQLDYEGEIAIIVGRRGRRITEMEAWSHIAAATLCNDGSIRDWLRHSKFNVTQGKNWDNSGSMGPGLVEFSKKEMLDDIILKTFVNGEIRQSDRTSRMVFSFPKIISYISTFCTLLPGDIIVCGTPSGAGARFDPPIWLKPNDVVEVSAQGLGTLRNVIADE